MSFKEIIDSIKDIAAALTPIVVAWIAYKQGMLNKKQDVIHKQINGQQELILKISGAEREAIGKEKGKVEQRDQGRETAAAVVDAIKKDVDIGITTGGPAEVKIVNENPIVVKNVQPDKSKTK